jgi:beta-galactosidase/beta-glucuronidase
MRFFCQGLIARCVFALMVVSVAVGEETPAAGLPRPEHPLPQMVRAEWLNLNGTWEFAETNDTEDTSWLSGKVYPDKIVVPFCRESKLSGLARTGFVKNVWYRRTFQKRADWKSPRVRLHIGACDWKTTVWINGQRVGEHTGGSAPFCFDVTEQCKPGSNTIVIHAFDDTRSGLQATGKQAHTQRSEGCVYTRTTGIWQTVWLEGVGSTFLNDVRIEPDLKQSRVILQAELNGLCDGLTLKAVALADGKEVASAETPADWRNNRLVLNLSDKRLWSIEDPFLYDLKLVLLRDGQVIDSVDSYFGLREVTIRGAAILINGKPMFQRTVLDQGFYRAGIWTAPNDEALRNDIKLSQAAGFNGARLHQKVFEPRFLYWADRLGYIVWSEFPNWGLDYKKAECNLPVVNEWVEIVRRDRNHPAVIGWCPFNETPPEAGPLQKIVCNVTQAVDPSRPLIESSGYYHGVPNPDVLDAHDYDQNPASFRAKWNKVFASDLLAPEHRGASHSNGLIPFFVSEYGGIGWNISGGWGYGSAPKDLDGFYARFQGLTDAQLDNPHLFGYCYTQLTDVEQEQNGLYTYDRKPKFDVKRLHKIQSRQAAYEKNPPVASPGKE